MARHRFEAPTLLEAVREARSVLGPEALVIGVRRLPHSRWPWGRREPCVQVLARAPGERGSAARALRTDAALLEGMVRLADEMADLRRAVEALERSARDTAAPLARRGAVRALRNPSPTSGSADAWSRESSSS